MGYLLDSIRSLLVTMRGVFREPTTVQYPVEKRERSERYRTSFALLHDEAGDEACVGCLQCEKVCPSEIITVIAEKKESPVTGKKRGYAKDFTLDLNACIYCELCVQVCPTDAIVMCRVPETPSYSREELCLSMDRLYENEHAKPAAWGTASLLMSMQDPKRGTGEEKKLKGKAAAQAKSPKTKAKAPTAKAEAKPAAEKPPTQPGPAAAEVKPVPEPASAKAASAEGAQASQPKPPAEKVPKPETKAASESSPGSHAGTSSVSAEDEVDSGWGEARESASKSPDEAQQTRSSAAPNAAPPKPDALRSSSPKSVAEVRGPSRSLSPSPGHRPPSGPKAAAPPPPPKSRPSQPLPPVPPPPPPTKKS